jgi:hypothetical protein
MWQPRPLTPLWAFTACYRDSFTVTFTAVTIKSKSSGMWHPVVQWVHQSFKGTHCVKAFACFLLVSCILMLERGCSSEMLVNFCRTTWCHITEDGTSIFVFNVIFYCKACAALLQTIETDFRHGFGMQDLFVKWRRLRNMEHGEDTNSRVK